MSWWVIHSCELAPYFTWVEDQGDGRASFFDKNAIVRVAIIYDENIHLWSWCWSDIQSCFYWSQKSSFSFFTKGCPSLFKLGKPIRNSCLLLNTYCYTAFSLKCSMPQDAPLLKALWHHGTWSSYFPLVLLPGPAVSLCQISDCKFFEVGTSCFGLCKALCTVVVLYHQHHHQHLSNPYPPKVHWDPHCYPSIAGGVLRLRD